MNIIGALIICLIVLMIFLSVIYKQVQNPAIHHKELKKHNNRKSKKFYSKK